MKLFHFGAKAAPLLGTLHTPSSLSRPKAAVLLCNPFGEEAMRAHRIYRVLATQLTRHDYAALRFDYSCSGDSLGDSRDASVPTWLSDIELALDEVLQRSKATQCAVFGLKLGATLAATAFAEKSLPAQHLVLWDPAIDGQQYLEELAESHNRYLRMEFGAAYVAPQRTTGTVAEALGHPIGSRLGGEIASLGLMKLKRFPERVTVISTQSHPRSPLLREYLEDRTRLEWVEPVSEHWNSDEALNRAVVPMPVIEAIAASLQKDFR